MINETLVFCVMVALFMLSCMAGDFYHYRSFRRGHWVHRDGVEWQRVTKQEYLDAQSAGEEVEFHGYW